VILEHWDDVTVYEVNDATDIRAFLDAMFKPSRYRTVILDGLTEYHAMIMATVMKQSGRASNQMPQLQDYGAASVIMLNFLRDVRRQARTHFLTTAGQAMVADEASGVLHVSPDVVGKLSYRVPRYFHIVGHLTAELRASKGGEVSKEERRLQVQPFSHVRAKDRSSKLGAVLEDPTMRKIYDLVYTHTPGSFQDGHSDPTQENITTTNKQIES